ncbi:MAG: 4Fe-4S dicluster domain-containing protein [Actinomycetota bacterium]
MAPAAASTTAAGADAGQRLGGTLRAVDHATAWVERPIRRLVGSARLNPLPHAGTISIFLLGVVVVSGLYLTLFFEFGHEASYRSVAAMEEHAIQRVARALHRYASAVLVVTTVVHAWRVFAAGRFTGRLRRWRWATGVASLVLVWLTGVTGYWLVWDERAQAINEIVIGLTGRTGWGVGLATEQLGVVGGRSGSGFLLLLWFAHLGLTAAIVWFAWRHLRRTKQAWLPPPHWMALMGVPLLLVSLAFPLGMLEPADPAVLTGRLPIDPFVLFLLPPLLSSLRWVTLLVGLVALAVVTLLPRLLRRRDPEVVTIVDDACTGCELCVADCPYDAIRMVDRSARAGAAVGVVPGPAEGGPGGSPGVTGDDRTGDGVVARLLAAVDPERCVGCGVCLGSCAFAAIELPGVLDVGRLAPVVVAGRPLTIVCDRHVDQRGELSARGREDAVIHPVRCAGALAPTALRAFAERGATDVGLVGCAPADCRYGIGNTLAAERLRGERRPHPPSRYARRVTQDWVAGDRVAGALAHPGEHPELDTVHPPARREALLGVGAVALLTVVGAALATRAPFGAPTDEAAIRVVVDHRPGRILTAAPDADAVGAIERVEVRLTTGGDGRVETIDGPGDGGRWSTIADLDLGPNGGLPTGTAIRAEVRLVVADGITAADVTDATDADGIDGIAGDSDSDSDSDGDGEPAGRSVVVIERTYDDVAGRRLVFDLTDRPPEPGVEEGRRIFTGRTGGCDVCHSVDRGDDGVGPTLHGVASVAGARVEGLDAEGYLRQSILLPDQYVVDGWPAGQMLPIYRDRFSEDELDAVIAYLLTLDGRDG